MIACSVYDFRRNAPCPNRAAWLDARSRWPLCQAHKPSRAQKAPAGRIETVPTTAGLTAQLREVRA